MNSHLIRQTMCCAVVVLLALPLASCGKASAFFARFTHEQPAHPKKTPARSNAQAFVQHLALARITLDSADDADADLDVLQAYSAQKRKPSRQTVLLLEYKLDKTSRTLIAPVDAAASGDEFPALLSVMEALDDTPYTLQDIHPLSTLVDPPKSLSFTGLTLDQTKASLDQEQRRLQDAAHKLPPLDDAKAQMRLARFFTAHGFRDPAYLAVSGAKQALASAAQHKTDDPETIKALSQELDAIAADLHQAMPFGL